MCPHEVTCRFVCRCPQKPREGIGDLGTGFTGSVSSPAWMLGIEPGSCAKAVNALNCFAISPDSTIGLLYELPERNKDNSIQHPLLTRDGL